MKSIFTLRHVLVSVILLPVLMISCKNKNEIKKTGLIQRDRKPDSRMTDIQGAMEYEFNMLKNPATGKIPGGIRDMELAQARQVLAQQQPTGRITTEVNPYTFQGPNNLGGRTRALAYDVRNGTVNSVIMAGGVSGGIYKSSDDGATWVRKSPTGDIFNVTALAQDTRVGFRDTWYYTGGEYLGNSADASGASYLGKGVYKSVNNGETWTLLPASNTGVYEVFDHRADLITKIAVDPTNGNVYTAALDAIYRSTDGGTSWSPVLTSTSGGFGSDMVTDIIVTSTGRLYAAFSGDCNSLPVDMPGVWTSPPGGPLVWTKIAGSGSGTTPAGWNATGAYGRVVLAHAPSLESRVYALYWNGVTSSCTPGLVESEMYYWDDGISTWTNISATLPNEAGCSIGNDPFAVQTGYDLVLAVKPDDAATVFIGGTNIYRSTTTGASWTRIGGYAGTGGYTPYASSHPDIHAIAFSPVSPVTMLCGNDGGIQRTTDNLAGTVSWSQINTGYRTYQYYYVDIDPRTGNDKVIGGAQDNGSTRNIGGTGTSFESVFGGDGVSVGLSDIISSAQWEYVGFQNGDIISRESTDPANSGYLITPAGESGTGLFVTLFKLDPDNTERLYYANDNVLYRTATASTLGPGPGVWTTMTGVAAEVTASVNITAIALSRGTYSAATSSLFFGTSDGRVFRLDNPTGVAAATLPVNITGGSFPAGYISSIAVNPRNDDTLLVTFSSYGVSSAWWTGNANTGTPTWTTVEGNISLPSWRSAAIHAVPNSPEVHYFVGTSVGLYTVVGLPGTTTWTQEGPGDMGNAVISSLAFRPADANLLVGTHGYGMWKTVLSILPLPVELAEFKGVLQNKNALLQWSTSAEYNSKHFELEKSFDGINFTRIVTIPAAGNSNTLRQYSYVDREPLTEKNYYRLRTVDIDNESKLSNIVLIKVPEAKQDLLVLGNPFKNNILVRFVKAPAAKGELRLIDMGGRLVASQVFGEGEQQVWFIISSEKTVSGAYILQAVINRQTYITKVLKE